MNKIELTNSNYKIFSDFAFVAKARAKETTRYKNKYLYVEKNKFVVATDGHRLHVAYFDDKDPDWFETGFYEVVKATKTKIILLKAESVGNFPKWQDMVPHHQAYYRTDMQNIGYALGLLGKHNITLDYKYLLPVADTYTNWKMFLNPNDNSRPIRFIENVQAKKRREAIFMPIHTEMAETPIVHKWQDRRLRKVS